MDVALDDCPERDLIDAFGEVPEGFDPSTAFSAENFKPRPAGSGRVDVHASDDVGAAVEAAGGAGVFSAMNPAARAAVSAAIASAAGVRVAALLHLADRPVMSRPSNRAAVVGVLKPSDAVEVLGELSVGGDGAWALIRWHTPGEAWVQAETARGERLLGPAVSGLPTVESAMEEAQIWQRVNGDLTDSHRIRSAINGDIVAELPAGAVVAVVGEAKSEFEGSDRMWVPVSVADAGEAWTLHCALDDEDPSGESVLHFLVPANVEVLTDDGTLGHAFHLNLDAGRSLEVRARPSPDATVVGKLQPGEPILGTMKVDNWLQLSNPAGFRIGWIQVRDTTQEYVFPAARFHEASNRYAEEARARGEIVQFSNSHARTLQDELKVQVERFAKAETTDDLFAALENIQDITNTLRSAVETTSGVCIVELGRIRARLLTASMSASSGPGWTIEVDSAFGALLESLTPVFSTLEEQFQRAF